MTEPTDPGGLLGLHEQPVASSALGRFQLLRPLGEGAMGVVFEARDTQSGALIALKALKASDAGLLYRLKNEFRAIADLRHPNLIRFHELHSVNGLWFFTMERIEGVPLNEWVRPRGGGFDEQRVRTTFGQLSAGICAIHAAGKLHRDLKPSNVLVASSGRVVILDFGLATDPRPGSATLTRESVIVGTPAYMAPEQKAGLGSSPASDWYAMGVMLYESLTGDRPAPDHAPPSERSSAVPSDLDWLCQRLLATDVQHRPDAEEIAGVLSVHTKRGVPVASARPFVGRQDELAKLRKALHETDTGKPIAAWISGQSGIGKTALAERFAALAATHARVLFGRCHEREAVPFNALDGLIDQLCRELRAMHAVEIAALMPRDAAMLVQVFPVLLRIGAFRESLRDAQPVCESQELRRRAIGALKELLRRLALSRPLVLAIDDMHWGDLDSAYLLGELLRAPDSPALLLVGCYRSEEAKRAELLQRLLPAVQEAGVSAVQIELGPLGTEEGEQLAAQLLERAPGPRVADLVRDAGGVPFLIDELARYFQGGSNDSAPLVLNDVLAARTAGLPQSAKRLLALATLAARPLPVAIARASIPAFDDALDVLSEARLVRLSSEGCLGTYHDRIREYVARSLTPEEVQRCHRLLAAAFEQAQELDHEALAAHWLGAGEAARAAQHAAIAADRAAAQMAFARAAELYGTALIGTVGRERSRLLVQRADALAHGGRGRHAAECYLEAAALTGPHEQLSLRARAAEMYLTSGNVPDGMGVVRPLLQAVRLKYPDNAYEAISAALFDHLQLRILGVRPAKSAPSLDELSRIDVCLSIAIGLICVDDGRGFTMGLRGLRLAVRAGDTLNTCRGLPVYAYFVRSTNPSGRQLAARYFDMARCMADTLHDPQLRLWVDAVDAASEVGDGDWVASLAKVEPIAQSGGLVKAGGFALTTAHHVVRVTLAFRGDMTRLNSCTAEHLHEARARGDFFGETGSLIFRAWSLLAADDADGALSNLESTIATWSVESRVDENQGQTFSALEAFGWFVRLYARLYRGETALAHQELSWTWRRIEAGRLLRNHGWSAGFHMLKGSILLTSLSAPDTAARSEYQLQECIKRLRKLQAPRWSKAAGSLLEAGLLFHRGQRRAAAVALQNASDGFDTEAMLLHAAACRRRWGEMIGGDSGRDAVASADCQMMALGVKDPVRWTRTYAPGFDRLSAPAD